MTGAREWIKGNPALLATGAGVVVLIAVLVFFRSGDDDNAAAGTLPPAKAFYTTDDGATYFAAARQIPPFDHNGKPAVQAFVFEFGDKKAVGYLMRGTPNGVERLKKAGGDPAKSGMQPTDWEVKRPGDSTWISMDDPRSISVMSPQPPAGASGVARLLEP